MSEKLDSIIDSIAELSVLELSELVKALEEKFGVEAAAPMMMGAMPMAAAAGDDGAAAAGPTAFDVILKEHGSQKIAVIKLVKEIGGLGLKEAKEIVDGCPKTIKEKVSADEANKIKEQLEGSGAVVELKGV
ncbi:MAG: 50S ribosomal protein L7/L12 [Candidatus Hydrogenedentes bacterium]|nr:50S ribosomal protein L7/L12 [Candidatus Hydrogenedentota bacterium]